MARTSIEPPVDPLATSIRGAARRIGVGRSMIYNEIKAGRLLVIKIGRRSLIATGQLEKYVADRLAEATIARSGGK